MLLKILGGVAATGVAAVTTYAVSKKVSEHIANARPAQETTEGDNL